MMTETRPKFPRKDLPFGTSKADAAAWEKEWNEEVDKLEARGPIRFVFEEDREYGYLGKGPIDGETQMHAMIGTIELGTYEGTFFSEGFGLSVETLRNNPFEHVPDLSLQGVTDEHVRALCSRPGINRIELKGLPAYESFAEDDGSLSAADRAEIAKLVEHQKKWVDGAAGVGGILTDACLEVIPNDTETLRVQDTSFTDAGVSALVERLPKLIVLALQSSSLTGEFLKSLSACPELVDVQCSSPELEGGVIMANLPTMPEVTSLALNGPRVLEGLDAAELKRRLPALEELIINQGSLADVDLYRVALGLPGVVINGVKLSERAVRKAAKKLGIEL